MMKTRLLFAGPGYQTAKGRTKCVAKPLQGKIRPKAVEANRYCWVQVWSLFWDLSKTFICPEDSPGGRNPIPPKFPTQSRLRKVPSRRKKIEIEYAIARVILAVNIVTTTGSREPRRFILISCLSIHEMSLAFSTSGESSVL
jgi:hypothetical protein